MGYWIVKFYWNDKWVGILYSDEEEAQRAFTQSAAGLGNPHLMHAMDVGLTGKLMLGPLSEVDRVEFIGTEELKMEVLDSASREEEK